MSVGQKPLVLTTCYVWFVPESLVWHECPFERLALIALAIPMLVILSANTSIALPNAQLRRKNVTHEIDIRPRPWASY